MKKKLIENLNLFGISVFMLVILTGVQVIFIGIQKQMSNASQNALTGILNDSNIASNSYYLSQLIAGLEKINFIHCAELRRVGQPGPSFYRSSSTECTDQSFSKILLNGETREVEITSVNGEKWSVSFKTVNGNIFKSLLWITRIASVMILILAIFWHQGRVKTLLEIEAVKSQNAEAFVTFAFQVAHDIRAPLSALRTVVRKMEGPPSAQMELINSATSRIQNIANELLELNKSSAHGKIENHRKLSRDRLINLSDFRKAINHTIQEVLPTISTPSIAIEFHDKSLNEIGSTMIRADYLGLTRIISNLITNSIEAVGDNGEIQVELSSDLNHFFLTVHDNGKGIPPDVIPNLWKKGFSYNKVGESGNGLGLYHCKMEVESWGGECSLKSELNIGTSISIKLQLSRKKPLASKIS